ncbi:FHA domain-containing protein [Pseudomonas sp. NPDC007930]|uniref:SctD/MshK family protein n=1 Tax=Pseudomonas sp. NPDC007930 TaxID=3364417 RepID=UPI0036E1FEFC
MTALTSHAQLPPTAAEGTTGTAVLDILAGLHQGVTLGLDRDQYTLGRASSADVVLHDDAVAERHVRLRLNGQRLTVEALGGDVRVRAAQQPQQHVPKGHGLITELPVELHVGQARLAIRSTQPVAATPAWRKPPAVLGVALMLVCGSVFALREPAGEDFSVTLPATAAAPKAVPSVAQARTWLDHQLDQAGLASTIHTDAGEHQISVAGSFTPAQKASWDAVQRGFDSRYGEHMVLHGNVAQAVEADAPRVRFQAVWFGKNPYVIDGTGRHLFPGAALEDRWVLDTIDAGKVVLARGEERFTFTL